MQCRIETTTRGVRERIKVHKIVQWMLA